METRTDKEIDVMFFKSLSILLNQFISPKSECMKFYIYKSVSNILDTAGFHWDDVKFKLDGTDYWIPDYEKLEVLIDENKRLKKILDNCELFNWETDVCSFLRIKSLSILSLSPDV